MTIKGTCDHKSNHSKHDVCSEYTHVHPDSISYANPHE